MPRLSDTMEEGTVGRWLKHEGDRIEKGEIIAEIQTDKANMELEAFQGGVLERILVQEGETVPIGEPIAVIGTGAPATEGGRPPMPRAQQPAAAAAPAVEAPPREQGPAPAPAAAPTDTDGSEGAASSGPPVRIKASPLARRVAQELGVDLSLVRGTGPNGRINRVDVEKAAATTDTAPAPAAEAPEPRVEAQPALAGTDGQVQPLDRMQRIVAERMVQSKTQVPHIYLTVEIDMARAIQLRNDVNALGGQQASFNDIVVKACALALRSHPVVNSRYTEEGFRQNTEVNVGIAIALEYGLIVPVVRSADTKMLRQIAAESRDLIQKARDNKLGPVELSGGTFTVSNLGMYGVEEFDAVINQPEGAILAVGAITEKTVVENGQIVIGHRMKVTLSADHRVIYGAHAAEFLRDLRQLLGTPLNLGY
ncbi:MAG: 2-oxo acid dehydrogenase subunit E2 [Chloroflexota bacterium]|nr:2-oxo acid dehydrogenase subunit E2 [Chloroflexota bacterium]